MYNCSVCESDIESQVFMCENNHSFCVLCFSNYAIVEIINGKDIYNLKCVSQSGCASIVVIDKELQITKIIKNNNNLKNEKMDNELNEKIIECSCGLIIQKLEGPECNHLICTCQKHYCWVCKKDFESSYDVYKHFDKTSCMKYSNSHKADIEINTPRIGTVDFCRDVLYAVMFYIFTFICTWIMTFGICVFIWVLIGKPENNVVFIVLISISSIISAIISFFVNVILLV